MDGNWHLEVDRRSIEDVARESGTGSLYLRALSSGGKIRRKRSASS